MGLLGVIARLKQTSGLQLFIKDSGETSRQPYEVSQIHMSKIEPFMNRHNFVTFSVFRKNPWFLSVCVLMTWVQFPICEKPILNCSWDLEIYHPVPIITRIQLRLHSWGPEL